MDAEDRARQVKLTEKASDIIDSFMGNQSVYGTLSDVTPSDISALADIFEAIGVFLKAVAKNF